VGQLGFAVHNSPSLITLAGADDTALHRLFPGVLHHSGASVAVALALSQALSQIPT
jgi:hypothetical protein